MSDSNLPPDRARTLTELVARARAQLPQAHWDYLTGAAETETGLLRNRSGLDALSFRPRILNDVSSVSAAGELLGQPLRMPVLLAPLGSMQLFDPEGSAAAARAAQAFGVLQMLSSVCLPDYETLAAQVPGPRILQLYLVGDERWLHGVVERALELGYTGLCLTADTQVYSRRERDMHRRWTPPSGRVAGGDDFGWQSRMTWDTVAKLKARFDMPLIIKGVNAAEDAARCVDAGVDVVYVSDHGGRQLDHTRPCIDALAEVVPAVNGAVPVWVDGGFYRGADVVKALCLGASGVGLGRLQGLALAAGGAPGLVRMLEIMEHEIHTAMALLGCATLAELQPELLVPGTPLTTGNLASAFPLLDG
ncbi:MAG: alpha-hydroxy acid oxidase [Pseudomonadales bacterium]